MIVSPMLPRDVSMPGPAALLEQTLEYELRLDNGKLLAKNGPYPVASDFGLTGLYWSVTIDRSTGTEYRVYTNLVDGTTYYPLSFTAPPEQYERYVADYWNAVRSIRPRSMERGLGRPQELFGE